MHIYELHTSLKSHIQAYLTNSEDIETLHDLRVGTRKLMSNTLDGYTFSAKQYKKLIKKSNEIRDIDVFISEIVPSLTIDFQEIMIHLVALRLERSKEFKKFLKKNTFDNIEYTLQSLPTTSDLSFLDIDLSNKSCDELHKIRKLVKYAKYTNTHNKPLIKQLSHLQDLFGEIQNYHQLHEYATRFTKHKATLTHLQALVQEVKQKNLTEIDKLIPQIKQTPII